MKYRTTYVVEGEGNFPIDMLRYDCAFPATEGDAHSIDQSYSHFEKRRVTLAKYHTDRQPSIGADRWKSFTWRFVEIVETVKR